MQKWYKLTENMKLSQCIFDFLISVAEISVPFYSAELPSRRTIKASEISELFRGLKKADKVLEREQRN